MAIVVNNKQTNIIEIRANGFLSRLRGLLFTRSLAPNRCLVLSPCNAIHCFGMLFSIDVIFLDRHNRVIHLSEHLRPFMFSFKWRAVKVIECAVGTIERNNIKLNDIIFVGE